MGTASNDIWEQLDDLEREILVYMGSRRAVSRKELEEQTKKAVERF